MSNGGSPSRASVKNSHSPSGVCATGPIRRPAVRSDSSARLAMSSGARQTSNISPVGSTTFHGCGPYHQ